MYDICLGIILEFDGTSKLLLSSKHKLRGSRYKYELATPKQNHEHPHEQIPIQNNAGCKLGTDPYKIYSMVPYL
jgi:hypothetical protein